MSLTRTNIKRLAIIVALSAATAVAVVFYRFKTTQDQPATTAPQLLTQAILATTGVQHTATQNGEIQWQLQAESAEVPQKGKEVMLTSPDVVFYSVDGRKIELTAARGTLNTATNDLTAAGEVRLFNNQYELRTEKLVYQHAQRLLESKGKVRVQSKAMNLQANAMTYDIERQQAHFSGQVEGTFIGDNEI